MTTSILFHSSPKSVVDIQNPKMEELEVLHLEESVVKATSILETCDDDEKKDENDLVVRSTAWLSCTASQKSLRTQNPIRAIVDPIMKHIQSGIERGDGKNHISLALGDPTVGGNLPPCQMALDAVVKTASEKPHAAGYINACGLLSARQAIADYHSSSNNNSSKRISAENVIIASGCSGVLELVLTALLDPGTFILVPQPGFPLYQVIAESHGASVIHYRLNPDTNWEIDLDFLESCILKSDQRAMIRGILINNPSNPTGAVFSLQHLQDVVALCDKYQLPIVADEVYGNLRFGHHKFHPLAQVVTDQHSQVPVITTSGLAKQFLLPGWRVGWAVFQDNKYDSLREVEAGAKRLAQVILGASNLVQSVIPALLTPSPQIDQWTHTLRVTLEKQAQFLYQKLSKCHGLSTLAPQGAMYFMVRMNMSMLDIHSDVDFSTKLLEEENVFVLPGSAFGCTHVFRVAFCCEEPILEAAAQRIAEFCLRHAI